MNRSIAVIAFAFATLKIEAQPYCPSRCPFLSYDEARVVLEAYPTALPPSLGKSVDPSRWSQWVESEDRAIRQRLDQGEEDTLSNLLRFGVTFTREYRLTDDYLPKYGNSTLVNSFADNRAKDLIAALGSPSSGAGIREMREFIESKGYSVRTPAERDRLKQYLLRNLARLRDDFLKAHSAEAKQNRSHAFEQRGISLDTNLWPDYDLDVHLKRMIDAGLLQKHSVHRVAVVGPGLDFVNKVEGLDLYPPQTIQPFAVMDSLIRLGLSDLSSIEVYTLDISARVNLLLQNARRSAASGQPSVIQLPWRSAGRWTDEVRRGFTAYWNKLGDQIGTPVRPATVPEDLPGVEIRAVQVKPDAVARVHPLDLNVVFQRVGPELKFDLIIGTNVFLYYNEFEQSLARVNLAAMLARAGYLLSNDELPERVPADLALALKTELPLTPEPVITELLFSYARTLDGRE
ncbi:MAG: hypothetical protein U0Q18_03840 [Bryobacteraceae bacterium]